MSLSQIIAILLAGGLLSNQSVADEPGNAEQGRVYALQIALAVMRSGWKIWIRPSGKRRPLRRSLAGQR